MPTTVVRVDAVAPEAGPIARAVEVLREGGVVALPTETFYGLAAAASSAAGVQRVFTAKGRPASMPLLVLVDSPEMVSRLVSEIPESARTLMARHWPGPLTLVFRAASHVPAPISAGTGTIGIRLTAHAVARAVVAALGEPVTAPSANRTGAAPPTTAAEVLEQLDGRIDLVLDAGATSGGPPSTVLDVTAIPPRVIRSGAVVV